MQLTSSPAPLRTGSVRKPTRGVIEARFVAANLTPEEDDTRLAHFLTLLVTFRQTDEASGGRFVNVDGQLLAPLPMTDTITGIMSHG